MANDTTSTIALHRAAIAEAWTQMVNEHTKIDFICMLTLSALVLWCLYDFSFPAGLLAALWNSFIKIVNVLVDIIFSISKFIGYLTWFFLSWILACGKASWNLCLVLFRYIHSFDLLNTQKLASALRDLDSIRQEGHERRQHTVHLTEKVHTLEAENEKLKTADRLTPPQTPIVLRVADRKANWEKARMAVRRERVTKNQADNGIFEPRVVPAAPRPKTQIIHVECECQLPEDLKDIESRRTQPNARTTATTATTSTAPRYVNAECQVSRPTPAQGVNDVETNSNRSNARATTTTTTTTSTSTQTLTATSTFTPPTPSLAFAPITSLAATPVPVPNRRKVKPAYMNTAVQADPVPAVVFTAAPAPAALVPEVKKLTTDIGIQTTSPIAASPPPKTSPPKTVKVSLETSEFGVQCDLIPSSASSSTTTTTPPTAAAPPAAIKALEDRHAIALASSADTIASLQTQVNTLLFQNGQLSCELHAVKSTVTSQSTASTSEKEALKAQILHLRDLMHAAEVKFASVQRDSDVARAETESLRQQLEVSRQQGDVNAGAGAEVIAQMHVQMQKMQSRHEAALGMRDRDCERKLAAVNERVVSARKEADANLAKARQNDKLRAKVAVLELNQSNARNGRSGIPHPSSSFTHSHSGTTSTANGGNNTALKNSATLSKERDHFKQKAGEWEWHSTENSRRLVACNEERMRAVNRVGELERENARLRGEQGVRTVMPVPGVQSATGKRRGRDEEFEEVVGPEGRERGEKRGRA